MRSFVSLIRAGLLTAALLLAAGGLPLLRPAAEAVAAADGYVLDVRGGQTLLLLPESELALAQGNTVTSLGVTALSARFLPDGQIIFVDGDLALRQMDPADPTRTSERLPAHSANAPLSLSPDAQTLAYLKPEGIDAVDNEPSTNGVAVLDLATNQERVLYSVPGLTLHLYGWSGTRLLLEVPHWSEETLAPDEQLVLAALDTTLDQPEPEALALLPALAPGAHYPQTSLDQRYLSFDTPSGLAVATLGSGRYTLFAGAEDPLWTEGGLTASRSGQRQAQSVTEAELSQYQPVNGPVKLPKSLAPDAHGLPPAPPTAPNGIFLYRPVKPSTKVSAYYDLDRSAANVADWTGWTANSWVYGHAYDQHSGTDFDGKTGDAVYASAVGTVIQVVIDCANTYPGGPATFGSYVRIEHGVQDDGNSYRTLYGHLKCDAVFTFPGAVITPLPWQLAQMGNTGWSTGDHTHLQVYRNLVAVDPYTLQIIGDAPPVSTIGDVQGVVRDASGQPAAGVQVKLATAGPFQTMLTGPDGGYRFIGVRVGGASLTAVSGKHWGRITFNIQPAQTLTAPDLNLTSCAPSAAGLDGCPALAYDAAIFLADVTVPDSGVVAPGQPLNKIWRLRNTGSSTWGSGYQLVLIGGASLDNGVTAIDVPTTAPSGSADLLVAFTAPADLGARRSYWRLRSPEGAYFGPAIWAQLDTQPVGSAISVLSASPGSPSAAGSVQVLARVEGMANFRALRLVIDGAVVAETTATELSYNWLTAGLDPVEHSVTAEAAELNDAAWTHPQRRGINYAIQAAASAAGSKPLAGSAHRRPVPNFLSGGDRPGGAGQGPAAGADSAAPGCTVLALPGINHPNFTVAWGGTPNPTPPARYDVQFLDSGRGFWRDWLVGVPANSAPFNGQPGHRYSFRCRAQDDAGSLGTFPDAAETETLVGSQAGQPDLRVIDFTAVPDPGGGVQARLTIQNDSGIAMERGFFADLYLDHAPSGP
ncbi:MAG: NBR1-Ig-like domain-containing protein, partial [Burkholderiaceae bacterium]